MSECNKCGITDVEIKPKEIKKYLGEKPQSKNTKEWGDSYWEQTDRMFLVKEFNVICRMCDMKQLRIKNYGK